MNQLDIPEIDLSIVDKSDTKSEYNFPSYGRNLDLSKHEITTNLFIINTTRSKFDSGIFSTRYILPQCTVDIH